MAGAYLMGRRGKVAAILTAKIPLKARKELLAIGFGLSSSWQGIQVDRSEADVDWKILLAICCDGEYETDYRDAFVIDCGAHKGFFGAYALARGAAHIVSYEPDRTNFAVLDNATACHRNWRAVNAAVGPRAGRGSLVVSEWSWAHHLAESGGEPVEIVAIADVVSEAQREAAGRRIIVKLDIEGGEAGLVRETSPFAWMPTTTVIVEVHSSDADEAVQGGLQAAGFLLTRRVDGSVLHFSKR